jgi:autotransporter-associated beta strand protein
MSTDRSFTFGSNDGAINISNFFGNLAITGSLCGNGRLIKNGSGTLSLKNSNSHKGTIINSGTIQLTDDAANISGLGDTVTFRGGTLSMHDNSHSYTDGCSWHIVVPEGKVGKLELDSRSSLTGKLFGGGKLILHSPWIRNDLNGDWSEFSGTIEITTDNDGGDWRINNSYGYENASVNLKNNVYAYNLTGSTKIGGLSGSSGATLASGVWSVGYNNENATYSGLITGTASINKFGTGNWILTNANDYTGTTNIYEGTLTVSNNSGSATGAGSVFVRSGAALNGNGTINGTVAVYSNAICEMGPNSNLNGRVNVQGSLSGSGNLHNKLTILNGGIRKGDNVLNGEVLVREGGTLSGEGQMNGVLTLQEGAVVAPGTDGIGKLSCESDIVFADDCTLEIEIDKAAGIHDILKSSSGIKFDGTLKISEKSGSPFGAGDNFKIFEADSVNGMFETLEPETPGDGLDWDLSRISEGVIGVTYATAANSIKAPGFLVYPNPANGLFNLKFETVAGIKSVSVANAEGRVVYARASVSAGKTDIDLRDQPNGTYFLKVEFKDVILMEKLIIQ